jgi:hypothetical protein
MYGHRNGLFGFDNGVRGRFRRSRGTGFGSRNNAFETMRAILSTSLEKYRGYQKGLVDINGMPIPKRRRSVTGFNWERARACILAE